MVDRGGADPDPARRLLTDAMLGTLTRYLRFCGYDAAYALDRGVESDDGLLALAVDEDRLLVTRDVSLAERAGRVHRAILLREVDAEAQLRALADRGFDLSLPESPTRCGRCNGRLDRVPDESIGTGSRSSLPDYVPDDVAVWRCRDCGQHFWRGSHWDDVAARLAALGDDES